MRLFARILLTLYFFLLVIISLMCGSAPAAGDVSIRSVYASIAMVSGWVVLAHVAGRWMARQVLRGELHFGDAADYLRMQMETFRWFALPITLICHYGFSLSAYMRIQPVLESSMFLQAIVLLMPGMTLLAATWSAEYYFAATVGTHPNGIHNYVKSISRMFRSGPAWLIVPTLVVMAIGDLFQLSGNEVADPSSVIDSEHGVWLAVVIALAAMIVAMLVPYLVRWMVKKQPMDPEQLIETQAWLRRCGISTHRFFGMQIARWDTGARMLNAMVAGFVRPGRLLLMSDRLLDELPRGQRLMVVMHELAHVKRWHVPLRMVAILPAWFVSSLGSEWLIQTAWFDETIGGAIGAVFGLVTTVVTLGTVSHFCELDADATACRLAMRACRRGDESDTDPEIEITEAMAAGLMADALVRVTADHPASRKMSWLHPSLATRVGRLRRIADRGKCSTGTFPGSNDPAGRSGGPLPDSTTEGHTWMVEGSG